jgi:hypothetical protein
VQVVENIKREISRLHYPHSKRYAEDAKRAFGQDSAMAEAGKIWAFKFDMLFAGQGGHEAMSLFWASSEGKVKARRFETTLLEWARNFVN